jgi:hypothetical protein
MDAMIREMILINIANNIAKGREPMPMYDDAEEVVNLYREEVERFKTNYGATRGWSYSEVLQFEQTYGVSVIELDYKRRIEHEEFGRLSPWERAPETWAN